MTEIVLVPGFWLGAWAWDDVAQDLRARGHEVRALTLPGLESRETDRRGISLDDHISAVADVVASSDEPVVLVGHSGAGSVVHGVVDRLPQRVAVAVYVDSGPIPAGSPVEEDIPQEVTEVPPLDWPQVPEQVTAGLSPEQLATLAERAVPHPAGPARDPLALHNDEARRAVPTVVITSTMSADDVRQLAEAGAPYFAELVHLSVRYIEVPTGHWPMFSAPHELAVAIASAADRVAAV